MTSTKSPNPPIKKNIEFPCLMEYKDGDFVVMFYDKTQGAVVWSEYDVYPVGYYGRNWNDINCSNWIPYEGSITLKN